MRTKLWLGVAAAASLTLATACTNDPTLNTATGALAGAAVGSQVGGGSARVGTTLAGAAIGATVGANQPTTQNCTYRNTRTGQTWQAPC